MPTWLWIALGVGAVWLLGKKSAAAPSAPATPADAAAQAAFSAALQATVAGKCGAVSFNVQPDGAGVTVSYKGKDGVPVQLNYPTVATAEKFILDIANEICVSGTSVAGFGRTGCCG